jgi:hypothetical protein
MKLLWIGAVAMVMIMVMGVAGCGGGERRL